MATVNSVDVNGTSYDIEDTEARNGVSALKTENKTTKDNISDTDQIMIRDTTEKKDKLIDYDKLADAILTKITSKQFTLDQGSKTLVQALNELNSNQAITITSVKTSIFKTEITLLKAGNIVVISYTGDTTDNVKQGDLQVIGTIPPDYVPRAKITIAPIQSTVQRIQLTFDYSGNITAYNYGNKITTQVACRYNGCYVC